MHIYTTRISTNNHLGRWCCSLRDKNMNVKNKTEYINSNVNKRRERFAFTVKKYDFDILEINRKDILLENVIKDCRYKFFHTFEH